MQKGNKYSKMYSKEGIHLPKVGEKSESSRYTYDKYRQVVHYTGEFVFLSAYSWYSEVNHHYMSNCIVILTYFLNL